MLQVGDKVGLADIAERVDANLGVAEVQLLEGGSCVLVAGVVRSISITDWQPLGTLARSGTRKITAAPSAAPCSIRIEIAASDSRSCNGDCLS